jgi:serine/threonine-protein kinase
MNLGLAIQTKGDTDGAIAEFRIAIRLKSDLAEAHHNLGAALRSTGDTDGAITEYRKAIQLRDGEASTHYLLGFALRTKGDLDGAIAEFRAAIRRKDDIAEFHYLLGITLKDQGLIDEAITECQKALRLKESYAEVHCALGYLLEQKGQFADALVHRRRGHELGSKDPNWRYPSAQWVRYCERLGELDAKLPRVLRGDAQPANADECVALAQLCQMPCKSLYAAAVRFYTDAFAEQPKIADDQQGLHRYNAACAAALAGCSRGKDAGGLPDKEYVRLRRQALEWLRADLAAYRRVLELQPVKAGPAVRERLQHWQQDTDFAGVRDPATLARLPEAERQEWQKLWADVAETLNRVQKQPAPEQKPETK